MNKLKIIGFCWVSLCMLVSADTKAVISRASRTLPTAELEQTAGAAIMKIDTITDGKKIGNIGAGEYIVSKKMFVDAPNLSINEDARRAYLFFIKHLDDASVLKKSDGSVLARFSELPQHELDEVLDAVLAALDNGASSIDMIYLAKLFRNAERTGVFQWAKGGDYHILDFARDLKQLSTQKGDGISRLFSYSQSTGTRTRQYVGIIGLMSNRAPNAAIGFSNRFQKSKLHATQITCHKLHATNYMPGI